MFQMSDVFTKANSFFFRDFNVLLYEHGTMCLIIIYYYFSTVAKSNYLNIYNQRVTLICHNFTQIFKDDIIIETSIIIAHDTTSTHSRLIKLQICLTGILKKLVISMGKSVESIE